jgi:hypothetical protein
MVYPRQSIARLTAGDVATLARLAGLALKDERLPRLTAELEAARRASQELAEPAARSAVPGGEPFDAGWEHARGRA